MNETRQAPDWTKTEAEHRAQTLGHKHYVVARDDGDIGIHSLAYIEQRGIARDRILYASEAGQFTTLPKPRKEAIAAREMR